MEKEQLRKLKNQKEAGGITLIALVITIVVLLILAGITISLVFGKNGIITKAQNTKEQTIIADEKEAVSLAYISCKTNNMMDIVTDEQLQQELENNGRDVTVTTVGNKLEVLFNETKHVYTINENGRIEEYVSSKRNITYAKAYCKKILALARNPSATKEAEKYHKYFDNLIVEDREEFLIIHANAISNYIYGYSRNSSQKNGFDEILETLTYKGEMSKENYTPLVQAEYIKNAGALMRGYSSNASSYSTFVDKINKYNPYVTVTLQSEEPKLKAEITYNKDLEEVKVAREEILGDCAIAYSRNPSLRDEIIRQFNELVAIGKNEEPSAKEQAGAVKTIGKVLMAYVRNPSLIDQLFGQIEISSSLIKNVNLEEVQVARAETLEALISAINKEPNLSEEIVNYYNYYVGIPPEKASPRVQAISLYNSGNLLEVLVNNDNEINNGILNSYEKVNIDITENTDEIQAASLANIGKLYWTLPFVNEAERTNILEFFRTKLYKKITNNTPIIQAGKYYSDGYYDSAYQEIMKIEDKAIKEEKLRILEEIKKEFSPDIEIDYTLEEVQIAKIEFLNTIYDSYYTSVGGRYFIHRFGERERILKPSEEYFRKE